MLYVKLRLLICTSKRAIGYSPPPYKHTLVLPKMFHEKEYEFKTEILIDNMSNIEGNINFMQTFYHYKYIKYIYKIKW